MAAMTSEGPSPDADAFRWFCVQTKPRAETKAATELARQDFAVFLPRLRTLRLRQSRRVARIEPMFPRYLFLGADPSRQSLASVRSTRGVSGLVRFGGEPATLPTALVDALIAQADADAVIDVPPESFAPGDPLRVIDGPLAGLLAVYREPIGATRALILLELLGQTQPIAVPVAWLGR